MKKILVPVTLAALVLAGCSSTASVSAQQKTTSTPSPSTMSASPSPTPSATTAAPSRAEQIQEVFLESVRNAQPGLTSAADEDLVAIGKGFCEMYDGGAVGSDINNYILKAAGVAYTAQQLVAVHGAAVGAFCPEHEARIDQ
jgi:PBP1b-binding outer membrane lipoprotein LpoB